MSGKYREYPEGLQDEEVGREPTIAFLAAAEKDLPKFGGHASPIDAFSDKQTADAINDINATNAVDKGPGMRIDNLYLVAKFSRPPRGASSSRGSVSPRRTPRGQSSERPSQTNRRPKSQTRRSLSPRRVATAAHAEDMPPAAGLTRSHKPVYYVQCTRRQTKF